MGRRSRLSAEQGLDDRTTASKPTSQQVRQKRQAISRVPPGWNGDSTNRKGQETKIREDFESVVWRLIAGSFRFSSRNHHIHPYAVERKRDRKIRAIIYPIYTPYCHNIFFRHFYSSLPTIVRAIGGGYIRKGHVNTMTQR